MKQVKFSATCADSPPVGSRVACGTEDDSGILSPNVAGTGKGTLINQALGTADREDIDLAR
jgi:hypothetical protein